MKRTDQDTTYEPIPGRHESRVAVVTGGAGGIGQAVARRLAAEGARVTIADVADTGETLAQIEELGGTAQGVNCDLSKKESVDELAARVEETYGTCDIVANIAGIFPLAEFHEMTWENWRLMFAVNIDSCFHLAKAFLPGMIDNGWGRIVNTASDALFSAAKYQKRAVAYAASKGAVVGFSRALASEVGDQGVTVNILSPGLTRTENSEALGVVGESGGMDDLEAKRFEPITAQQAINSTTVPSDHAAVVSFIVSKDAERMTGHTFQVDSGWLMNT